MVEQTSPFIRPLPCGGSLNRRDFLLSGILHITLLAILVAAGIIASRKAPAFQGGGDAVSVQMVVLESGDVHSDAADETAADPVETVEENHITEETAMQVEEMVEVIEETPAEEVPVEETPVEETPVQHHPPVEQETPVETSGQFIGVGSQGEAGTGAPGPASYEGRVFAAIRRNFRTSTDPAQSYRINFTVNLDGTHSHSVVRTSGDTGFDRAVEHAINSASIPPVPPGRTQPVQLSIEFFGPGAMP
jgi:TonB family protein